MDTSTFDSDSQREKFRLFHLGLPKCISAQNIFSPSNVRQHPRHSGRRSPRGGRGCEIPEAEMGFVSYFLALMSLLMCFIRFHPGIPT